MKEITQQNPFYQDYMQYRSQYGALEVIGACLYDTVQFTSAAINLLTFFANGPRATIDLTNMESAGILPAPKAFLVRALRFYVRQTARVEARAAAGAVTPGAIDNIAQLLNTGFFQLTIGNKPYAEYPLWKIPAGGGAYPLMAADGNTADPGLVIDYATNGIPVPSNALILPQPLFIASMVNFAVTITWPAAITLSGGSTNVEVVLDGDLIRGVQ